MFQIFIKTCDNTLTFISENNQIKADDIGKFVFKRTGLPRTWQRFLYSGRQFYGIDDIYLTKFGVQNESTIHLHLTFHGVNCNCETCMEKGILLRNGKRLRSL